MATEIEVKFKIDLKMARKCFVMLDEDVPSDEELISKLHNHVVDLSKYKDEDSKQAVLGFALMAIASAFDK